MHRGLVVADDLTGANDTGHEFAARGYETRVAVDPEAASAGDVLVVDTDSRYDASDDAAATVRAAIETTSTDVVYKKVDSTLRGNVAAEVGAALDATGATFALVAPAYPANGRITACGFHLVNGILLTDSEPGEDPETGPASPHVPTLFEDAGYPVETLGLETTARGERAVAERLRRLADETRIIVCDATHADHLASVAAGAGRLDEPVVYAGSAGLARHVTLPGAPDVRPTVEASPTPTARGALGIVGSVARPTLDALDAVPEPSLVVLDAEETITAPESAAAHAAERAAGVLADEGRAVVTAAADGGAVERTLAAGERAGLSPREVRERVAGALAEAASGVVEERPPRGFFLTGGDTAVGVLRALDTKAIRLVGEEVEAGIPVGRIEGGAAAGCATVTKAGAFGGRETAINCLDYVRSAHD